MIINEECKKCQIKRNINKYPIDATEGKITEYQYKVKEIVKNSGGLGYLHHRLQKKWIIFVRNFWEM